MSAVVAYVALHSRQSSRSRPDASPGRYSSGRPQLRAVGQPLLQDPLGHVVEPRSAPAGARGRVGTGPSRTSASSRRATSASLHPSPSVARGVQRVQLVGREDVAPGVRQAPGRREQTAQEARRGVSTGQMVSRACGQRATVDHVEERRRVPDPFRADAADPVVALEAVPVRGFQRPEEEALHQRPAGVVRASTVAARWRRWPRGRRARRRGGTDPPTARCPPAAPAGGPGPPGRGRRPCGDRP